MTAPEMDIRALLGREPGTELEQSPVARSAAVWRDRRRARLARSMDQFGRWQARLDLVRAFDAFPMTHHVECVAILVPADGPEPQSAPLHTARQT